MKILIFYINILILMSETLEVYKKKLYNFTQKAKKQSNKIIGTEMEVDQEIPITDVQKEDEKVLIEHDKKKKVIPEIQEEKIKLTAYEKEIAPYYTGCYSDDPTNLSMKQYLGIVSNPVECMTLGKKNGYKYIGIQQGDKCYGSNEIPTTLKVDDNHCGIHCNQADAGTCGGYFYNKVYNTNAIHSEDQLKTPNTSNLIENYNNTNMNINT